MAIHIVFYLHRFDLDILNFDDYSMMWVKSAAEPLQQMRCGQWMSQSGDPTMIYDFSLCLDLSTV